MELNKRYRLRNGSIRILRQTEPGKMDWVEVPQQRFDEEAQADLFKMWRQLAEVEPNFNIAAKIAKLLIEE